MYDNHFHLVTQFSIIIYSRLSKEEIGKSKEEQSKSIKNQIAICKRYIEDEKKHYPNCHFQIIATLQDDGISGTTFNRSDFKELINLIENKKANMVITTDLSRLGRNHIKTDNYIEEWFPLHNVRYVSIIEGIDTYSDTISNDIAPIINWANEHFAKLTSKKIKERFQLLRKEGKWTGGEPPFGYKIDPKNNYKFIIDKESADIVRRIFTLFINGHKISEIANILTNEKVPIPTIMKGLNKNINPELKEFWKEVTIKNILKNKMYLGFMIQGKTTKLNHKSKKIIYLPKEQWSIIKNTHEPIIDEATFNSAQLLFKTNKNQTNHSHDYLLKGLLICKECKHSIGIQHFKKRSSNYTVCNYYRKYGQKKKVCTAHRMIYEKLEQTILNHIKKDCLAFVNYNQLLKKIKIIYQEKYNKLNINKKIAACQKEISKINRQKDLIYEDRLSGLINEEQFKRLLKTKHTTLEYFHHKLEYLLQEKNKLTINKQNTDIPKLIKDFIDLKNPPKYFISAIIDKIEISENGLIDIYYKIRHPQ